MSIQYCTNYIIDYINNKPNAYRIWKYLIVNNKNDNEILNHKLIKQIYKETDNELLLSDESFEYVISKVQEYAKKKYKKFLIKQLFGKKARRNMDLRNQKASKVYFDKGYEAYIKYISIDERTGRRLSYNKIRELY